MSKRGPRERGKTKNRPGNSAATRERGEECGVERGGGGARVVSVGREAGGIRAGGHF